MLMLLADSNPTGERFWAAAKVRVRGRALTREEAEALTAQITHEPCFLMPVTDDSEQFIRDEGAPTLAPMSGQTIGDTASRRGWTCCSCSATPRSRRCRRC